MISSLLQDKVLVPESLRSLLYLWGLSQLGVACVPGTVARSIARSEQMGTALFPFYTLNGVFLEGGSCSRVAFSCSSTWFYCGCSNFIWLTDSVLNVDAGSFIPNFSTWEVFLEYWVPLGVSIMTLLPVLLTTWD